MIKIIKIRQKLRNSNLIHPLEQTLETGRHVCPKLNGMEAGL